MMPDTCEPTCTVTTALGFPVADTVMSMSPWPNGCRPVLNARWSPEQEPRTPHRQSNRRTGGDQNCFPLHVPLSGSTFYTSAIARIAQVPTNKKAIRAEPCSARIRGFREGSAGKLHHDRDREPLLGIATVVKVVAAIVIVVVDINLVVGVPVCVPVSWPWIHQQEREPAVRETRIAHVHIRHPAKPEEMAAAEREAEGRLGDVVTAIASALSPVAMVRGPVLGAVLLKAGMSLPTALLCPALLLLP